MASPLTWRTINTPNFSKGNSLITSGFDSLAAPNLGVKALATQKQAIDNFAIKEQQKQDFADSIKRAQIDGNINNVSSNLDPSQLMQVLGSVNTNKEFDRKVANDVIANEAVKANTNNITKRTSWVDKLNANTIGSTKFNQNLNRDKFDFAKKDANRSFDLNSDKFDFNKKDTNRRFGLTQSKFNLMKQQAQAKAQAEANKKPYNPNGVNQLISEAQAEGASPTEISARLFGTYGKDAASMYAKAYGLKPQGNGNSGGVPIDSGSLKIINNSDLPDLTKASVNTVNNSLKEGKVIDFGTGPVKVTSDLQKKFNEFSSGKILDAANTFGKDDDFTVSELTSAFLKYPGVKDIIKGSTGKKKPNEAETSNARIKIRKRLGALAKQKQQSKFKINPYTL